MDVGIVLMIGSAGLLPHELGRAVEERGFESLFYAEHTHIPVDSVRADGGPARLYADTWDPITLAKQVASLDRLSGGRFLFGIGAGWNREEMANHGTDPRTRMALMADRVRAMRQIWTAEEAEYHGPYADFSPLWSWPKPVQRPHPPVQVGGAEGSLLRELAAAGADRCLLPLVQPDADTILPALDEWARLV